MYVITVDHDKCQGCEQCAQICPSQVYKMENGKSIPVNASECSGCQSCISVCETQAITIEDV